ncbi:hypothetical protein C0Q70_18218 [Pomacea canaliculata]|uniref:Uncharacterized protein n=2 Tax=Pomacea canaliculata TaxID=400727 RepID=A0A2T7NMM7_POMCA|nr:steroidogenic factor 1-like isoform X2 [Pomacea canaliculata]XP_025114217.1 steroidogenic factor 1-like isoform X2 [Pomacea canaliculata]PVD22406.1 hypothetical protein C0Q70_18218 [Pomacea canaliculata]
MSASGDLGISPVLLQAISQTLTSAEARGDKTKREQVKMEKKLPSSKVVSHLLKGMNEPVSGLMHTAASSSEMSIETCMDTSLTAPFKKDEKNISLTIQERVAAQLLLNQGRSAVSSTTVGGSASSSDVSMVNVLTALASQHIKANIKQEANTSLPTVSAAISTQPSSTEDGSGERHQPQIIIYYNNDNASVPSPANDVIVGEFESEGGNYRVVMHQGDVQTSRLPVGTESCIQLMPDMSGADIADGAVVVADSNSAEGMTGSCPVCGDKLSGYHYGVFTCESCKGFFKRTVQNKKSFVCHKQSDCEINAYNRKKCPACRFNKCLIVGMKLEAIRPDRTRGGRSSYDGCSPHGKPKANSLQRKTKRSLGQSGSDCEESRMPGMSGSCGDLFSPGADGGKSHRQLVAILNHSNTHAQQIPDGDAQRVPELLTDIMNLEPLLVDDEIPQAATPDMDETTAFYNFLMQLTELRLYKLVRWARNLPQFGAISTDDQILLLQNCWSDLLALGVCWRSVSNSSILNLSDERSVTIEEAAAYGFGDVANRLHSITQSLQSLHMDQYEYVALKVLLLITPDVKGLKEPGKIRDYQEKLTEALAEYTSSHYVQSPLKFGEMLLRLPELARISFIAKEKLLTVLPPSLTSCGLLVELLKGENAVKD